MARVTVEDCIDKVENRFDLVLLASHRARMISSGSQITVDRDNDKNPVVALREIAETTVSPGRPEGRPDPYPAEIRRGRRAGAGSAADRGRRGRLCRFRRHRGHLRAHDRGRAAQGPRGPGAAGRSAGRGRRVGVSAHFHINSIERPGPRAGPFVFRQPGRQTLATPTNCRDIYARNGCRRRYPCKFGGREAR